MRWRVLTAVAILSMIIGGGLYCRSLTTAHCDQLRTLLLSASEDLSAGALPSVRQMEQAVSQWEEKMPLLSSLLHHDRLERVGQSLSAGLGYLKCGDAAGCMAQIDTALYLLDDIREYDDIRWQTLF